MEYEHLPALPEIDEEELRKCAEDGDYRPVLFEWYKYIGLLTNFLARIHQESDEVNSVKTIHFVVFKGLLNRVSRLMLANVALSFEGRFGESTLIIDRCIFETALKIVWLTIDNSNEKFSRYLADGLKSELELRASIEANIKLRAGKTIPVEDRMIGNIGSMISASGLTEEEILKEKKLPTVADILRQSGYSDLSYIVGMKVGSHAVHGTWPALLFHYLVKTDTGEYHPRDADTETDFIQYVYVCLLVLDALSAWTDWAFSGGKTQTEILGICSKANTAIQALLAASVDAKESALAVKS